MRGKEAILAACAVVVVGMVVYLALEAQKPADVSVDADRLARARADYARGTSGRSAPNLGAAPGDSGDYWSSMRARQEARAEAEAEAETEALHAREAADQKRQSAIRQLSRGFETRPAAPVNRVQTLDTAMDETNGLYDKGDYEGALAAALDVLERDPDNVRMLRVAVSSGCILGENDVAARHYDQLTNRRDRKHMRVRCKRYGVDLPE